MERLYFIVLLALLFNACSNNIKDEVGHDIIHENGYEIIQEKLLDAQRGETIILPRGLYKINRSISLDGIPNVTIKGEGKEETILSFLEQTSGAEGLRITADSITLLDFTVADAKGDAIKLQDCKGVNVMGVKTTWTQGAKSTNGGYGLYPVQCEDVVIDNCEAAFASDAGIYVGQSRNVVVKNCHAHHNVAGIEIENCVDAEVYDNIAENNTGGILVFDLPDLEVVNGNNCKVYNNKIVSNNLKNFAAEGNMVAIVPPGSGIILLAAKDVEIYNNEILDHKTLGIGITSFHMTELPWKDERYDPFTYNVSIHDNTIERKSTMPDVSKKFGQMVNLLFPGKPQDILYDGITKEGRDGSNPMNICIKNNKVEDLRFANIDAANDFDNVDRSLDPYECI
ncbi:parallel beta-helix domain-containing protein [Portibacter marinus]|uniref:parallel beta-helix domain-containing protein n=1 Tax=Portibacter marinus TaxID=2898660 RepID=UPI001F414263|nr:parallel beta-helix domain-containing protein [Portibacter marinus]